MRSIYRSEEGKNKILELYDSQLTRLSVPWKDIYVQTAFGRTHLIETGNIDGETLLVFHGGNATTAYNLLCCEFLYDNFHIYAVDIIGHPGKSEEVSLPASGYAYGKWAGEVIDALGFKSISLFGGSFGGCILPPDPGDIMLCGQIAENCHTRVWFPQYPMASEEMNCGAMFHQSG